MDTHKLVHVAVGLDADGGVIGGCDFPADTAGYHRLLDWAGALGATAGSAGAVLLGVEGTGSYGAGLTLAARQRGFDVVEVVRPDRRDRRLRGKSDSLDAENAARAVLSGQVAAAPKTADGVVEMIRQVKVAKDGAVKARTATMNSLRAVLVNAPAELREALEPLTKMELIHRCSGLRPGTVTTLTASTKYTLRAIARRWEQLADEVKEHEDLLGVLVERIAPQLLAAFGVGPDSAAALLIAAGDNAARIHSEPGWAMMCGVAPIPASSGMTTRYRLSRGGNRQANAALYRVIISRIQHHDQTKTYLARRTSEGKTKPEIIRSLKRLLAREIWALLRPLRAVPTAA